MNRRYGRGLLGADSGTAAIEYAVIGALIGIGLIGALVGTKGSLSSIFGVASSAMGSASSGSSTGATSGSAWASKTLATRNVVPWAGGAATQYQYTYTDGSKALYTVTNDTKNYPYNPSMELYSGTSPRDYAGMRIPTQALPNGVFLVGQETGVNTNSYNYSTQLKLNPDGSATDIVTGQPFTGTISSLPKYNETSQAYAYFGTLP